MSEAGQALDELRRILSVGALFPVFQPIVDFRARAIFGYEALIRGPEGSCLHLPDQLFATARAHDLGSELEHACRLASLRAFAGQSLSGRLFLNVSPDSLADERMRNGVMRDLLVELGIAPNRIVIELTENQRITDLPGILEMLTEYRGRGFQFAIDDMGEGFANLRLWSQLRPEFVKIDKHFVNEIAGDRIKYHFVRAMQDLAEICKASLVAEGIERDEDFACLRDMGIACGQGYFIARPAAQPIRALNAAVRGTLARAGLSLSPGSQVIPRPATAGSMLRAIEPIPLSATNDVAIARFEADHELDVLPVVDAGRPVGLINRHSMVDRFARPFRKELYGRKSCEMFMDHAPLVVDQHATLQELAMMLAVAPKHYLYDGFVVTGDGRYLGVGSSHDLMARITEMQISAARYANPLTQLPGNVPINEHIDRMLVAAKPFVAAYIDIDSFKPYNDTFGYRRGDDVIQLLGQLLCEVVDLHHDFVGHIGGDDFFVIFQSEDWELRCALLLARFAEQIARMNGGEIAAGGSYLAENRRGELVSQSLPSLSVGEVRVGARDCESHREVAAAASAAKKHAKKKQPGLVVEMPGGSLFVDRRRVASESPLPGRPVN